MSAIEIHISAERLSNRFGARAWEHAADHAEHFAAAGDWERVAVWRRIGGAIRQLERQNSATIERPGLLQSLIGGSLAVFAPHMASENSALREA